MHVTDHSEVTKTFSIIYLNTSVIVVVSGMRFLDNLVAANIIDFILRKDKIVSKHTGKDMGSPDSGT